MSGYEPKVFISYAWGGEREDIVNQIDESLAKRGIKIIRDKRNLGYKGSIKGFMERIGQGHCVIVVISDKYLRSPNCMFELVEIADNKQFNDRIFPIVLSDADIYDPVHRLEYVKYWELKRAELADAMRAVDPANLQGIRDDIDQYDRIRDKISGLASILKDMNTLTPDMHRDSQFSTLYEAILERIKESATEGASEEEVETNVGTRNDAARTAPASAKPSASRPAQSNISSGGFNIQGTNVSGVTITAGGDQVAGNKITYGSETRKADPLKEGFEKINQQINMLPDDGDVDKSYLKMFVKDIQTEVAKGTGINEKKLRNSFKMLMQSSEDIYGSVAGLLRSAEVNVPVEIQNLLD